MPHQLGIGDFRLKRREVALQHIFQCHIKIGRIQWELVLPQLFLHDSFHPCNAFWRVWGLLQECCHLSFFSPPFLQVHHQWGALPNCCKYGHEQKQRRTGPLIWLDLLDQWWSMKQLLILVEDGPSGLEQSYSRSWQIWHHCRPQSSCFFVKYWAGRGFLTVVWLQVSCGCMGMRLRGVGAVGHFISHCARCKMLQRALEKCLNFFGR